MNKGQKLLLCIKYTMRRNIIEMDTVKILK